MCKAESDGVYRKKNYYVDMKNILSALVLILMCYTSASAQKLTGFGTWRLYHFMDEFGDLMYNKPFLETKIINDKGKILTIAFTNKIDSGLDVMSMGISDQYSSTTLDRNATVSLKSSDGQVKKFKIPDYNLKEGQIYIGNQADLAIIASILNKGNCKVSISAHWGGDTYVSPNHVWSFHITNQTIDLLEAYARYLQ